MRVLVTGGAGFVGQHLCRDLTAREIFVRALVRDAQRAPLLSGVEVCEGDLCDERSIRAATEGIDVIAHLASRVHVMRDTANDPLAEFRRVNVAGTQLLATAATDAGVKHIVFASSVKAIGETSITPWDSTTPAHPVDPYGISKLEAEQVLLGMESPNCPAVTVLRFPLLYGPGMKGNMLRLFRAVARGWPVPVAAVENARSMLFVGNAVSALTHVITADPSRTSTSASRTFFVADGPAVSTAAIAHEIADALGAPSRIVRLPQRLLRNIARIGDPVGGGRPSAMVSRLIGSLVVDETEFEREYQFAAPFTRGAGLELTARWFLQT